MSNYPLLLLMVITLFLSGCETAYYNTMERFGYHKRDLLVSRVEDARDAQQEAKEQFRSALEKFSMVVNFQGGELQQQYELLNEQFERSQTRAEAVHKRINEVENVAEALFDEWESELSQYTNASLRRDSEQKLSQTRQRYEQLIGAMRRAEKKIDPVLSTFRDQVLFLKHNLNAQAIASLQDELASVETDITSLIRELEKSIAEANAFIQAMARE